MNQKLIDAIEALATKALNAPAFEAHNYAQAANQLSQAANNLHYAEHPTPLTSGSTDEVQ